MVRQRLNLVSDAPVPGPGSGQAPRRWMLSRASAIVAAAEQASTPLPPPPRSYLSFLSRSITVVVVGVAATYAATKYALARIADIQRGITSQRRDSENLRRRFAQNQEDCSFTVLALLPTLDSLLAKSYNVDSITRELSAKPAQERATAAPAAQPEPNGALSTASAQAPSTETAVQNAVPPAEGEPRAPALSESVLSSATAELSTSAIHQEMVAATTAQAINGSTTDVVQQKQAEASDAQASKHGEQPGSLDQAQSSTAPAASALPIATASSTEEGGDQVKAGAGTSASSESVQVEAQTPALGESRATLGESAVIVEPPQPEPPALTAEEIQAQKRRKVELWNELKIVAFTRTITSLYAIVLLSLQTHIQLNVVGRFNYLASVAAIARANAPEEDAYPNIWDASSSADPATFSEKAERTVEAPADPNALLRSVEQRYLTYSWWLLHRGALSIGQEVERAVKHVLGTVPLKAELSLAELHRLVREVRRIVEWERVPAIESTLGGGDKSTEVENSLVLSGQLDPSGSPPRRKRRRHFLSAMFPDSPEGEREILAQAGVPTSAESELLHTFDELEYTSAAEAAQSRAQARAQRAREDAQLAALVDESKDWIDSDDFERVLALCLERVFGIWETNLAESAFGGSAILRQGSDEAERERLLEELSRPRKVRLAALLPAVNVQSRLAMQSLPNEYAEAIADVKELKALSALIYSSWST